MIRIQTLLVAAATFALGGLLQPAAAETILSLTQ